MSSRRGASVVVGRSPLWGVLVSLGRWVGMGRARRGIDKGG